MVPMSRDLPDLVDVDVELTRFIRRVRVTSLRRLETIHPQLDYGTFLFLVGVVNAPDGIRGSELAESLGVHKSTASRAIASLERMGLVRRVADPDDGRAQLLMPEPVAVERIGEYRRSASARIAELLADWTPDEVATFARSLARLNDAGETIV